MKSNSHKIIYGLKKGEGEAVPLQAWSGPEVSRKLRFPDFMTTPHVWMNKTKMTITKFRERL